MAYVIGVDCGTSGTKTVLFDEKGTVISSVTIEYPMYQPKNGYAEQDPADWANAMINTIKAVMTKSGVNKEDVAGVGISGQMHGLVMLDKDDNVLRKSIIWCDQRTAAEVEEMNEKLAGLKEELFALRFQLAVNQLDNTARLKAVKKDIARIKTVLRENEIKSGVRQ